MKSEFCLKILCLVTGDGATGGIPLPVFPIPAAKKNAFFFVSRLPFDRTGGKMLTGNCCDYGKGQRRNMKKNILKSGFNLIEVTMAIAIVGIGIAGIMALFPPAIEANKVANNENYLGGVSETLISFLEAKVFSNFSVALATDNPAPSTAADLTTWTEDKNQGSAGFPELYQLDENKVFGVKSADGTVTAYISIWTPGAVPSLDTTGSSETINLSTDSRRVYVEVSWPAVVPATARQKKFYVFDCFKD